MVALVGGLLGFGAGAKETSRLEKVERDEAFQKEKEDNARQLASMRTALLKRRADQDDLRVEMEQKRMGFAETRDAELTAQAQRRASTESIAQQNLYRGDLGQIDPKIAEAINRNYPEDQVRSAFIPTYGSRFSDPETDTPGDPGPDEKRYFAPPPTAIQKAKLFEKGLKNRELMATINKTASEAYLNRAKARNVGKGEAGKALRSISKYHLDMSLNKDVDKKTTTYQNFLINVRGMYLDHYERYGYPKVTGKDGKAVQVTGMEVKETSDGFDIFLTTNKGEVIKFTPKLTRTGERLKAFGETAAKTGESLAKSLKEVRKHLQIESDVGAISAKVSKALAFLDRHAANLLGSPTRGAGRGKPPVRPRRSVRPRHRGAR